MNTTASPGRRNGHITASDIKSAAQGHWPDILTLLGFDRDILDGQHHPCPRCGGKDRFRLIDADAGAVLCNQCFGECNGDGIAAVKWLNGWTFTETIENLAEHLNLKTKSSAKAKTKPPSLAQNAWQRNADRLAKWAMQHLVNRDDAYGAYGKSGPYTCKKQLNHKVALRHFLATGREDVIGSHSISLTDTSLSVGLDIDAHGEVTPELAATNLKYALAKYAELTAVGFTVLLYDSNGKGGYHLRVLFNQPTPSELAFRFGRWLVRDWKNSGLDAQPESFPSRKDRQSAKGYGGGWLRWPGRHHTRDVWATVYDGTEWLADEAAVDEVLRHAGNDPKLIPPEVTTFDAGAGAEAPDDRVEIVVTTDESVVNDAAIAALASDDSIFQRGGKLVHVVTGDTHDGIDRPDNAPRILSISLATLRERLTLNARFVTETKTEDGERETKPAHPPKWNVEAVAARGHWSGIRHLAGVVTSPVLRPDGTVLITPGYDPATRLLFDPLGVEFPILSRPTRDDAIRASKELLDLVRDFPFAKSDHRSAWLAFLLTSVSRFAFAGPAPLFAVDANIRGSGKSLLADLVGLIVTGREMSRMANPQNDDEARKRITALAIAADTMVLIDNVDNDLGCAALDAALTATWWKDRPLGKSEIVDLPLNVTWCASGNNIVFRGDIIRRVCHIRLDSRLENPEQRDDLTHPDLKGYVLRNRPKLLTDALAILSAYCRAGRSQQTLPTWGSFGAWSDLVRRAIVWVDLPDPAKTRTELTEQSDTETSSLRELIEGWDVLDPDCYGLTTSQILKRLTPPDPKQTDPDPLEKVRGAILDLCPPKEGHSLPSAGSLGKKLGHLRGRVVAGRCLNHREGRGRRLTWRTESVKSGDDGDDSFHYFASELKHNDTKNIHFEQYGNGQELSSPSSPSSPPSLPVTAPPPNNAPDTVADSVFAAIDTAFPI